ncbi:hypothetical protein [Agrococcus sediminis]|uniref:hypothetical protein n=1 Tax=Agrococcus sediminis TaxID=2599924 RepID=UPI00341C30D4
MRIPPGWSARIGGEEQQHDLATHWRNSISIVAETGAERLSYGDGPGDESGPVQPFGVVTEERVETLDADAVAQSIGADPALLEHWARAWWQDGIDGTGLPRASG